MTGCAHHWSQRGIRFSRGAKTLAPPAYVLIFCTHEPIPSAWTCLCRPLHHRPAACLQLWSVLFCTLHQPFAAILVLSLSRTPSLRRPPRSSVSTMTPRRRVASFAFVLVPLTIIQSALSWFALSWFAHQLVCTPYPFALHVCRQSVSGEIHTHYTRSPLQYHAVTPHWPVELVLHCCQHVGSRPTRDIGEHGGRQRVREW